MSLAQSGKLRDNDYYREDGDIVIVVENTLFRIHKAYLLKEPSAFSDMFAAGSSGSVEEGCINDQPLLLEDALDEFRALCWVLYVLPGEITSLAERRLNLTNFEISRFLSLALISHKYQFAHFEAWSKGPIKTVCMRNPKPNSKDNRIFLKTCNTRDLFRLLWYSFISEEQEMYAIALQEIRRRLQEAPSMDPLDALQAAEKQGLRSIQGEAYYRILCDTCRSISSSDAREIVSLTTFQSRLPKGLSEQQTSRLIQGYFTLMTVKDQVFRKLTSHRKYVEEQYLDMGGLTNVGPSRKVSVDILGHLEQIARHAGDYVAHDITKISAQIEAELPDYFLGREGGKLKTLRF